MQPAHRGDAVFGGLVHAALHFLPLPTRRHPTWLPIQTSRLQMAQHDRGNKAYRAPLKVLIVVSEKLLSASLGLLHVTRYFTADSTLMHCPSSTAEMLRGRKVVANIMSQFFK